MNRRELFKLVVASVAAVAAGAGFASCIKHLDKRVNFPRTARYIGGTRHGTVHTVGPEVKLGSEIHLPIRTKGSVFEAPGFTQHETYSFHRVRDVKPVPSDWEWVWISHSVPAHKFPYSV